MCAPNTGHRVFTHKKNGERNAAQPLKGFTISPEAKGEGQMCAFSSLFTAGLLSISFKQLIRGTFRTSLFLLPLYSVLTRLPAEAFSSELVLKFLLSQMSSHHLSTLPSALLLGSVVLHFPAAHSQLLLLLSVFSLLLSMDYLHLFRLTWYLVGCFRDFLGMNSSPGCG